MLSRDWYHAAQSPIIQDPSTPTTFSAIDESEENQESSSSTAGNNDGRDTVERKLSAGPRASNPVDAIKSSAERELRVYELMALSSCFFFPLMAAWLLHAIRGQLTRPSEGLVSNYNLTIFILVAEIRPLSHLIKMIQRRTLFLQRRVNADAFLDSSRGDGQQIRDLAHKLEELEADIAARIAGSGPPDNDAGDALAAKASALATSDMKKTVQPELDALNRAMRRYEKRTTISSVQLEARLQDLETRLNDVVSLAAAAQRNANQKSNNYIVTLANWICAAVVVPVRCLLYISSLPGKCLNAVVAFPRGYVSKRSKGQTGNETRPPKRSSASRPHERERKK